MRLATTVFIMTISLMFIAVGTHNALSQTVTSHEFGGHTYLIVNEPTTWTNASTVAKNSLGYLVIVNSEQENQFIYTNLLARGIATTAPDGGGAKYTWLGGSDAATEGTWLWVNTTNMNSGYTKWGHGAWGNEPDDYPLESPSSQNNLAMGLEGWPTGFPGGMGNASEWNDVSGTNLLAYVIEFDSPTLDTDDDGLTDWEEFIAATDPTNATSQLELNITPATKDNIVISWTGSSACSYNIRTKTNLLNSGWTSTTNIQGNSSTMTYTNSTPQSPAFYMIHVER